MPIYVRNPVTVKARQLNDTSVHGIAEWASPDLEDNGIARNTYGEIVGLYFRTGGQVAFANMGYWIVKDESGKFTAWSDERFTENFHYDRLKDQDSMRERFQDDKAFHENDKAWANRV